MTAPGYFALMLKRMSTRTILEYALMGAVAIVGLVAVGAGITWMLWIILYQPDWLGLAH